ncbi:hypothetical protein VTL71DRAFT_3560 [Oculimacula yallundae]|uniref:Uncharacterized protein n=1 Tax=Oculimacula yallundae TaxID=86028 RepID=A0ABR4C831_9HELO
MAADLRARAKLHPSSAIGLITSDQTINSFGDSGDSKISAYLTDNRTANSCSLINKQQTKPNQPSNTRICASMLKAAHDRRPQKNATRSRHLVVRCACREKKGFDKEKKREKTRQDKTVQYSERGRERERKTYLYTGRVD